MAQQTIYDLGLQGQWYSIKHDLGHYISFGNTATYSLSPPPPSAPPPPRADGDKTTTSGSQEQQQQQQQQLRAWVEAALQATIAQHAALRFATPASCTLDRPQYVQVRAIHRDDVLRFDEGGDDDDGEEKEEEGDGRDRDGAESYVVRTLEREHDRPWPRDRPLWRCIAFTRQAASSSSSSSSRDQDDDDAVGSETTASTTRPVRLTLAFLVHHALADGGSGAIFQASFLEHLTRLLLLLPPPRPDTAGSTPHSPPGRQAEWPLEFPEDAPRPPLVQDLVDMDKVVFPSPPPPPQAPEGKEEGEEEEEQIWAGGPVQAPGAGRRAEAPTRLRTLAVPAPRLAELLASCRRSGITLTGLLHALVCASVARTLSSSGSPTTTTTTTPTPRGVRAITPFSLRGRTGARPDAMVNHVSYATQLVPAGALRSLLPGVNDGGEEHPAAAEAIKALARDLQAGTAAEAARPLEESPFVTIGRLPVPGGGEGGGGGGEGVSLLAQHCRAQQTGRPRGATYELSNLGLAARSTAAAAAVGGDEAIVGGGGGGGGGGGAPPVVRMERMLFTQCATMTGPALTFSCASVGGRGAKGEEGQRGGGPMTLSVAYQRGVVEEETAARIFGELRRLLQTVAL